MEHHVSGPNFRIISEKILKDLCPCEAVVCLLYVNAFVGKFGFILRDKKPNTLEKSK